MTIENKRSKIIKEAFTPFGKDLATSMAEELEVKGGLLLEKNTYIKQKTKEFIETIDKEILKREQNMDRAGKLLKEKLALLPSLEKTKIEEELGHSAEIVISFLKDIQDKKEPTLTNKEETFQSLLGLSNETLLWIYTIGYNFSLENKHEEALAIFQMLTSLNPLVSDYFVAQGLSERSLKSNQEALYSFAMASILNPEQPISRYNAAEIYLETGQVEDAKLELEALEKIIETNSLIPLKPAAESLRGKIQGSHPSQNQEDM